MRGISGIDAITKTMSQIRDDLVLGSTSGAAAGGDSISDYATTTTSTVAATTLPSYLTATSANSSSVSQQSASSSSKSSSRTPLFMVAGGTNYKISALYLARSIVSSRARLPFAHSDELRNISSAAGVSPSTVDHLVSRLLRNESSAAARVVLTTYAEDSFWRLPKEERASSLLRLFLCDDFDAAAREAAGFILEAPAGPPPDDGTISSAGAGSGASAIASSR